MKKILLLTSLFCIQLLAAEDTGQNEINNRVDIRMDSRGSGYQRSFAELHTDWGAHMGAHNLKTLIEVETHGGLNGSFELWYPITKNFYVAPTIKYTYEDDNANSIKPGVFWSYMGFENITIGGRVRKDIGLSNMAGTDERMNLTRTDFLAHILPQNDINFMIKATYYTSQTDIITSMNDKDWAEMTLETHFSKNPKFSPYIGYTFATKDNIQNNGGQGIMLGFSSEL